ncbi:conserved hypothetical protein, partial [Ricinus communis]
NRESVEHALLYCPMIKQACSSSSLSRVPSGDPSTNFADGKEVVIRTWKENQAINNLSRLGFLLWFSRSLLSLSELPKLGIP